jgi:DNA-binding CsgD family transcriptional regulator
VLARGARGVEPACILLSDFPEISPAGIRRLADHATGSIKPFWWSQGPATELAKLRWASRLERSLPGSAGLAFPVAGGLNGIGFIAFIGDRISVSDRTLPDLHHRCFALFSAIVDKSGTPPGKTRSLGRRELECIRLAADGLTSEEIANALGLSLHTANQYLADAARKLNANGRMHAVAKALRLGLID